MGRLYFIIDIVVILFVFEIGVEVILMGKNGVFGIYDLDLKVNKDVKKFGKIFYDEILDKKL